MFSKFTSHLAHYDNCILAIDIMKQLAVNSYLSLITL